ncbi:hypothetical protein G7047_20335 [Diaphorobacter sp. HDW4A]|uniref:hypothetical protein n=1 Tax=Diaphorobacter sp. HDW4A TaxID=2714924 RepID=UPI00140A8DA8|nr:hypothetical protein [Diaphorobacter sp. HDW4A]QIL82011.1 hypothetical protein G7047_20335 [Diaphorobacter sp. HDW4A]
MGLLNEIIGAVVAEEALSKADPHAGFLKKTMAAVAGYEGEKFVEGKITQHEEDAEQQQPPADQQ